MTTKSFCKAMLVCFSALFISSCSGKAMDRMVDVDESDKEMSAAISNARSKLPTFFKILENPANGETDFCLKVKVTDKNGVEHFWLNDLKKEKNGISGVINNDPEKVKSVKIDQRITIEMSNVSDWLYMKGGKMYGNYTLRPIFKSLSLDEQKKLKAIMVDD